MTELKTEQFELIDLVKLGGLVAVPTALVMLQPDLGTALTYLPILIGGIFLAGLRWQYAVAIVVVVALVMPVAYFVVLKDYQRARRDQLSRSESRPERLGLSSDSVQDRGGSRRALGKRRHQGNPDSGTVFCRCRIKISSFRPSPKSMVLSA